MTTYTKKSITEHELQKQIVQLFRMRGFQVFVLDAMTGAGYFSQRDPRRFAFIADLKARGYTKGQPDLCVVRNRAVFIELKRGRGGHASPEQKDMWKWLVDHGHQAFIIKSVEEAIAIADNPSN